MIRKLALALALMASPAIAANQLPSIGGPNGNVLATPVATIGYDSGTGLPCVVGSSATCKQSTAPQTAVPLGCAQLTSLSASTALSPPTGATVAAIVPEAQNVRWRDDGTAPTATVGMLLLPSQPLSYGGSLTSIRFIETTPSAKLNVCFY